MTQSDRIYIPLVIDMLFIFAAVVLWHTLAYAQCAPFDLNCMNLP